VLVSGFVALDLCDDVLDHVEAPGQAFVVYKPGRGLLDAVTSGYRARSPAPRFPRRSADRRDCGSVVAARAAFFFTILKSELATIEDRGSRFGLVHDGAAGLDDGYYLRPDSPHRGGSYAQIP